MKTFNRPVKCRIMLIGALLSAALVFPSCQSSREAHSSYTSKNSLQVLPSSRNYKKKKKPRINIAKLEAQIHRLINRERKRKGLKPLAWNAALSRIARTHSKDMARRDYFHHYSPEGHDFLWRYERAGYSCGIRIGNIIHTGGENILQNNLYDSVTTINGDPYYDWNSQKKIAETSVRGWMKSPGHRKNILTPHWQKEGIGVVIAPDGKVYITQNFC